MSSQRNNAPSGHSNNHNDYQKAFLQRVHCLLQLAYESLTPSAYQNAEEDDVTGELCKHMKLLTEDAPTKRWMCRYSVHDQDPVNDVRSLKTGVSRKGKRRPKLDIRLVCKVRVPNQRYCIEAKRLYRSDSISEYVDAEGVGAFVCDEYARGDSAAGMLAYVQTGAVKEWLAKVMKKVAELKSSQALTDKNKWTKHSFRSGPPECYLSRHRRDSGKEINIFHVMFSFVGSDENANIQ